MSARKGPRSYRLSKAERVLLAIVAARRRFENDEDFVREVNSILLRERILDAEDFGSSAGDR